MASSPNNAVIGRKWQKVIHLRKTRPDYDIKRHRQCIKDRPPVDPQTLSEIKEARHRQEVASKAAVEAKHGVSLQDRIDEVYENCKRLSKLAEEKAETSHDYKAAANCLEPGIKAIGLMAKDTQKDDDVPGIDRAIAKMKERRDGK